MSNLPFPEKILHQHIATLGKTGAGKSSAMRVIAEHLLDAKRRLCIVDPKGDWWGLKSSADGKSAGYPVIMFGDFKESRAADVPINDRSGKHVAELIASGNRPCVLGFRGWMPAQLVRFWLDFAPTLFNTNEGELYVLIDEVQNFAPKGKIFDPDAGKCLLKAAQWPSPAILPQRRTRCLSARSVCSEGPKQRCSSSCTANAPPLRNRHSLRKSALNQHPVDTATI